MRLTGRVVVMAAMVVCGVPALVCAQGVQAGPKAFVGGVGGLTFGTVTSGAVAGQGGVRIAPGLFVTGEVGYMRNVLPKKLRDEFDGLADDLQSELGVPVSLTVSVPSTYGFGGLRWSPPAGRVAPFVEGGVGVAHIHAKIDKAEVLGIDISDDIQRELGDDSDATKFLLALGGGINAQMTKSLSADVGFRYTRIATEDPAINSSMVYGAVKVGF